MLGSAPAFSNTGTQRRLMLPVEGIDIRPMVQKRCSDLRIRGEMKRRISPGIFRAGIRAQCEQALDKRRAGGFVTGRREDQGGFSLLVDEIDRQPRLYER